MDLTLLKISKARIQLMKENPFFAYLALNLILNKMPPAMAKMMEEEGMHPTMGVDNYGNLFYHDDFVNKLEMPELKTVLCHEVLHIAFEHLIRVQKRGPQIWNIVTDMVINDMLLTNGFKLPSGNIIRPTSDHKFELKLYDEHQKKITRYIVKDIDKKTPEKIYDEIKDLFPKEYQSGGGYGFDKHIYPDFNNLSPKQKKELEKQIKKWKSKLVEAATNAKFIGNVPAGLERIIDDLLQNRLNWREILYKYIVNEVPYDYTYKFPSKRSQATGIYMPSMQKEKINITVAIDTSGSISNKELTEFLTEVVAIKRAFNNVVITLIQCDAEVGKVIEIDNNLDELLEMKFTGGGGTSHIPVYKYVTENIQDCKLLINFTDGYTEFPQTEEVKTLWILTSKSVSEEQIPFGTVIKIEDDEEN